MISRYETPEMARLFTEISRFVYMLEVEKTVAWVQAKEGLIPQAAAADIVKKSKIDLDKIKSIEETTKHDVIAFVTQVAQSVGKNGKYIHFGLTSSDVLDTALSLQISDAFDVLFKDIQKLKSTLSIMAKKHKKTICVGRTHGMYAEITTFGFKMMGFLSELSRAEKRLKTAAQQMKICKLSGAVGTSSSQSLTVEKNVARLLGLEVEPFATQVIPRDRHAEVIWALSFYGSFLERLSIELRHLQRTEVSEVVEGFLPGQKGSSAMPHKKNPISAENITGLARLLKGFSHVAQDNIALWHERDISHSSNERMIIGDAFMLAHYMTLRMDKLLNGLYIDAEQMKKNTLKKGGVLFSSHVLLFLIDKGLSRESAYELIQKISLNLKDNEDLSQALLSHPEGKKYFTSKDIRDLFSGQKHLAAIEKRFSLYSKGTL